MRCSLLTELRVWRLERLYRAFEKATALYSPILSASLCQHDDESLCVRYCTCLASVVARTFPIRACSLSLDRRQHVVGDLLQDRKGDAFERRPDMQAFDV
jgi:hypothetical protein